MKSARLKDKRAVQEITLRLSNSRGHQITFILEPWGEIYPFGAGDEFVVIASGPMPGMPEVDFADESVTVFGWTGSTVRLFRNGEELAGQAERIATPEGPVKLKASN